MASPSAHPRAKCYPSRPPFPLHDEMMVRRCSWRGRCRTVLGWKSPSICTFQSSICRSIWAWKKIYHCAFALQKFGHIIDAITTTTRSYFDAAARVPETSNLPTSPVESLAISVDKYATRILFGHDAQVILITGVEDLREQMEGRNERLAYPLIVKPSSSCSFSVSSHRWDDYEGTRG